MVLAAPDIGDPLRTSTDQRGHFVFSGVAPRDYRVYAFDAFGEDDAVGPDLLDNFAARAETVKAATRSTVSTTLKLIHVAED